MRILIRIAGMSAPLASPSKPVLLILEGLVLPPPFSAVKFFPFPWMKASQVASPFLYSVVVFLRRSLLRSPSLDEPLPSLPRPGGYGLHHGQRRTAPLLRAPSNRYRWYVFKRGNQYVKYRGVLSKSTFVSFHGGSPWGAAPPASLLSCGVSGVQPFFPQLLLTIVARA